MLVRAYAPDDAAATLDVFLRAITEVASRDYSPEQIAAWARPQARGLVTWDEARGRSRTIVAELAGQVVGFTDVDDAGYVDMMFVSPDAARQGVATALLAEVRAIALALGAHELSTHASITARPFFESHGFVVVTKRRPIVGGVRLTNYRMIQPLDVDDRPRE